MCSAVIEDALFVSAGGRTKRLVLASRQRLAASLGSFLNYSGRQTLSTMSISNAYSAHLGKYSIQVFYDFITFHGCYNTIQGLLLFSICHTKVFGYQMLPLLTSPELDVMISSPGN